MGFVPDGKQTGRFVPDEDVAPVASKSDINITPPIEGAWGSEGDLPTAREAVSTIGSATIRHGIPTTAAVGAGFIPIAGPVAGPLAGVTTDWALSKLYGESEKPESERESQFGTDVLLGMAPGVGGKVLREAKKLIPGPIENKIASTVRWGFEKGVRPSIVGKSNTAQVEQYYKKAQSAVESIVENKSGLTFTDEAGTAVAGKLPQNLNHFSQAIDQTKRSIFTKYDSMVKGSSGSINLDEVIPELQSFQTNKVNKIIGGSGNTRADFLIENMKGQNLTLSETQDMIALLNNRLKAFYSNPSPDMASSAAIDALTANRLRAALDKAVDESGYQVLKNQYGALRSIEKEVSNRALVDARKNTKGLIDFADIASAADAARAIATMNPGAAASAGAIKAMKEYYKYLNNPNRIIKTMFSDVDALILKRHGLIKP